MSERLTPKEVKALRKRLQGRVKLSKSELARIAEQTRVREQLAACPVCDAIPGPRVGAKCIWCGYVEE